MDRENHDLLLEVAVNVEHIKQMLEEIKLSLKEHENRITEVEKNMPRMEVVERHENRIINVERAIAWVKGSIAVMSAVVAAVITILAL